MRKLSIKQIIEFRGKSDKSKKHFVNSLKENKSNPDAGGGGDYWVSCMSAVNRSYKTDDTKPIADKLIELEQKYEETEFKRTKIMYKRNIDILYKYEDFEFKQWKPSERINFIKKNKDESILIINDLQIQAAPDHIFTFTINGKEEVGAIWFIVKLNGLSVEELGMYTDMLFRYLNLNYSKKYTISYEYCIAVDIFSNNKVDYLQLEKTRRPSLLDSTLEEIKRLI